MKNLPYSEGSIFLVPLRKGGFARGIVARATKKGKVLFGYFFGPQLASPKAPTLAGICPANAVLRLRFGDLGLVNGEWLVLGALPNWNRSEWSMPDFVRRDPLGRLKPQLVRYSDDDPSRIAVEFAVDDDAGLETDLMSGYGAVEIKLTKLLS